MTAAEPMTDLEQKPLTPMRQALANQQEALMAALTREPRPSLLDCEVGQEARTKEWYVKSLKVPQNADEGWGPWARRVGEIAAEVTANLPGNGAHDDGGPFDD